MKTVLRQTQAFVCSLYTHSRANVLLFLSLSFTPTRPLSRSLSHIHTHNCQNSIFSPTIGKWFHLNSVHLVKAVIPVWRISKNTCCFVLHACWRTLIIISLLALSHMSVVPKTFRLIIISSWNPHLGLFFSRLILPSGCSLTRKSHKETHSGCCKNIASFPNMGERDAWGKAKERDPTVDTNWNFREFATLLVCWHCDCNAMRKVLYQWLCVLLPAKTHVRLCLLRMRRYWTLMVPHWSLEIT